MHQQSYTFILIIALILFSIFRRVRRNIGWQELNSGKMLFRVGIFLVIGLIFFVEGAMHPISLISDLAGIVLGIALAFYSAGLTIFEKREIRWYYRPNIWIGTGVTALFIIRFIYRFAAIFMQGNLSALKGGQTGMQNFGYTIGNSWTAGLMLIMFAYYILYYIILIRKQKQLVQSGEN